MLLIQRYSFVLLLTLWVVIMETVLENLTTDNSGGTENQQGEQVNLYEILMPIFGGIIITLNLAVIISSTLVIKKGSINYSWS